MPDDADDLTEPGWHQAIDPEALRAEAQPAPEPADSAADDDDEADPGPNPLLAELPELAELAYPAEWKDLPKLPEPTKDPKARAIADAEEKVVELVTGVLGQALSEVDIRRPDFTVAEHVTDVVNDALTTKYGTDADLFQRLFVHAVIEQLMDGFNAKRQLIMLLGAK